MAASELLAAMPTKVQPMATGAAELIQSFPDTSHMAALADILLRWLVEDLNRSDEPVPAFTESRARALLRAADVLDEPTRHSFERLMENEAAFRIAMFDLLSESELVESDEVLAIAARTAVAETDSSAEVPWPSLVIAAFAWKSGYPLFQLDPASPPNAFSPAGQVLKRAATFFRQQVQRSATERDKLSRTLAYAPGASRSPSLDDLSAGETIPPLPPYFRPPIPVNYPEIGRETLHVDANQNQEASGVTRGDPISISKDDLDPVQPSPARQTPIQITNDQIREPAARRPTRVVTPDAAVAARSSFSDSVRKKFGRGREAFKITKLRVLVQEYPDGPGLYGLQVRVTCKGIKSHVAGTTTREGTFVCELPVPEHSGLTYDVDVTWPRDLEGETERKSITLNADRTEFKLPFYRRLNPKD